MSEGTYIGEQPCRCDPERPVKLLHTEGCVYHVPGAQERITELEAENEALQGQLPEGMESCTIEFHECPKGHGRLIATNWVYFDCTICENEALRQKVADAEAEIAELRKVMAESVREFPVVLTMAGKRAVREDSE